MRLSLVTLCDTHMRTVGDVSVPRFKQYCDLHGYSFRFYNASMAPDRHVAWSKIKAVRNELSNADWVLWIDADCVIADLTRRLEQVIEGNVEKEKYLAISQDDNGLCSGVFLLANCEWTFSFLDAIYFLGNVSDSSRYGEGEKWEQNAMKCLIREFAFVRDRVCFLPFDIVRSGGYAGGYRPGDFIHHFSFMDNKSRVEAMKWVISVASDSWSGTSGRAGG